MRNGILTIAGGVAAAVAIASLPVQLAGQARTPAKALAAKASAVKAGVPRTADGHPDLTGMYDLGTLTPLERPAGMPAVMTDEEAAKLEKQVAARKELQARAIKGDRDAPPAGGDGSVGAAGNVGGYNSFWIDSGSQYTIVDGQRRTGMVIDPENGRVPPTTPQARQRLAARFQRTSDESAREDDPGFEGGGAYDDPERRPLGERCLLGFASTSGPPTLPTYFYNNLHQIVQTKDTVLILTEMVHDVRTIRIGGEHLPKTVRKWLGDSVGHWEGDTLVVDTTNFTDKTRYRGSSPDLHIVERFTRVDSDTLRYRFTVEDPSTWTAPWTAEYSWPITTEGLYEYACHEGNYALGNILRGARLKEAEDAAKKREKQ
jgi:hypothetical protein